MKYEYITIVSEIDGDLQTWTFPISESDLYEITEKHGHLGFSVRGDINTILHEIKSIYS